jgi:flagellar basal-body rod protein FlgF
MIKGIYTAGRSLDYRIKNIDVIANNLSNLNTVGYKREIPFSEVINEYGETSVKKITSQQQGDLLQTSSPLDLAISGDGFFAIKGEDGQIELTRDGRFKLDNEGFLTDYNGRKVMGKNGEISIEESLLTKDSAIAISRNGEIKVGDKLIDAIVIYQSPNSNNLTRTGGSNFSTNGAELNEAPENSYLISQGFLEESNTNPIVEMEAMIQLNKEYESAQKVITALDASLQHANEISKI